MQVIRWTAWVAVLATAAGFLENGARAGNGTVPAPTGTIYFQDLSTLDPSDDSVMLYAMDGDGGNRTAVLRTDRYVRPSRLLHGPGNAARWFLTMRTIEGQEIGGNPRRDVFAVRADGTELRITSDPAMEYWMPEWAWLESVGSNHDFAVVSMLARRWTSDAADATVVEGTAGMYLSYLSFVGTPFVRGSSDLNGHDFATTQHPKLYGRFYDASVEDRSSTEYFDSTGGPTPDVASYAWGGSNLPDFLVVQDLDAQNPRVRLCYFNGLFDVGGIGAVSLEDEAVVRLPGRDPQVSHFSRLVLARLARAQGVGTDTWVIETYNNFAAFFDPEYPVTSTEATVAAPVNAATTRQLSKPLFEPAELFDPPHYVAYQMQWKATGTTNHICRESGGLGALPLTPSVKRAATGEGGMVLVAWR